jgi:flagellar M-ring protein FliF
MAGDLILPTSPGLQVIGKLRGIVGQPLIRRSLPMFGLLGVGVAVVLSWAIISSPAQKPLFPSLADGDKAAVAAALDVAGVKYRIDGDSGALDVSTDDYHRARMLLAGQGLPKSAPNGSTSLDALPIGASHALEGERLRGARETDLSRTVEAIDGVESAKIHLAVEQPSLFVRDRVKSSASVMVKLTSGRTLSEAQVQAIVHLVASSVNGLNADDVAVVDQAGHLLSTDRSDPIVAEAARQIDVQNRIEGRYRDALSRLLSPVVGADAFTAEVHADLNFDERQATRETFPESDRALREEQSHWTSAEGTPPAIGIPGTLSNTPPPASTISTTPPVPVQAGASSPRTSEDSTRRFELGREVSVSRVATGQIRRLSVAVALKEDAKKRSGVEIAALDALIKGTVGFDAGRGDVVIVTARPFQAVPIDTTAWWDAGWVATTGRNLAAIIVVALLIFGIGRPLLKRRVVAAEARRDEVAALIGTELDSGRPSVTLDMIEATPSYAARVSMVRDFVRANPARAALVVRNLVKDPAGA